MEAQDQVTVIDQVYRNNLIMEMIVDRAIVEEDGLVDTSTVQSLRLASKRLCSITSKVHQLKRLPLYTFRLDQENSVDIREGGKMLNKFIRAVRMSSVTFGNAAIIPLFELTISEEFFRKQNHESLKDCLVQCGEGLLDLELNVPLNAGSLKCVFPALHLPKLRSLTLIPINGSLQLPPDEQLSSVDNVTHLANALFNAATALECLSVPLTDFDNIGWIDYGLLTLSPSLKRIDFSCELTSTDLRILIRNHLPNLTSLQLLLRQDEPFQDGLLFQVLDNVKSSLKYLTLFRQLYEGPPLNENVLTFPVMEKLEYILFSSMTISLGQQQGQQRALPACFPVLEKFCIIYQRSDTFDMWTADDNVFPSVKEFDLLLGDETFPETDKRNFVLDLNSAIMQRVNKCFPNINKLNLTLRGELTCGVTFIFEEMTNLKALTLEMTRIPADTGPDLWDSLLIGAPVQLVAVLREHPDFWTNVKLRNQFPSIMNLKVLKYLELETPADERTVIRTPLISDLTFHLALLTMPKLRRLSLVGRFMASEAMAREWKMQNRILTQD